MASAPANLVPDTDDAAPAGLVPDTTPAPQAVPDASTLVPDTTGAGGPVRNVPPVAGQAKNAKPGFADESGDFSWSRFKNDFTKLAHDAGVPMLPDVGKEGLGGLVDEAATDVGAFSPGAGDVVRSAGSLLPQGGVGESDSPPIALMNAIAKTGYKTVSQLSSPENLTIAGLIGPIAAAAKGGSVVAQTAYDAARAYFASQLAYQAGSAVPQAVKTQLDPNATVQDKLESLGDVAAPAAMAAGVATHGEGPAEPPKAGEAKNQPIPVADADQLVKSGKLVPDTTEEPLTSQSEAVPVAPEEKPGGGGFPGTKESIPHEEPAGAAAPMEAPKDESVTAPIQQASDGEAVPPESKLIEDTPPVFDLDGFESEPKPEPIREANEPTVVTGNEEAEPATDLEVAKSGEPFSDEYVTGIKNATVDAELATQGRPPATRGDALTFRAGLDDAMQKLAADPKAGDRLVESLSSNPRPLTGPEDMLLSAQMTSLVRERADAQAQRDQAIAEDNPIMQADAELRIAKAQDEYARVADITAEAGTLNGQGLAFRKAMLRQDYTLAGIERRMVKANNDAPLDPGTADQVTKLSSQLDAAQKQLDDYKAQRVAAPEAEPAPRAPRSRSRFADAAAAARERLKARASGAQPTTGLDVGHLADLGIVGADYLAKGVTKFADWSAAMVKEFGDYVKPHLQDIFDSAEETTKTADREETLQSLKDGFSADRDLTGMRSQVQDLAENFVRAGVTDREELIDAVHGELKKIDPEITRRQTMDAISGYGDFKPLNPDEIKAQLRDLKGQMQQVGKLEDMQAGEAPKKTGVERRTPSDEERRLIQQVEEAKKKGGFNVTDPAKQLKSALDAIKTRLKNQISDLEQQIESKTKIVADRTPAPTDAEADALRTRRDELKGQYDQIFGKEMTDEQRIKAAGSVLDREIARVQNQLESGALFDPEKRQPISTPALDAKRAELAKLREQRDNARQTLQGPDKIFPEPTTPEQRKVNDINRQIKAIEKQLQSVAIFSKGAKTPLSSPEIDAARAQLNALKQVREFARQSGTDTFTPDELSLQGYKARLALRIEALEKQRAQMQATRQLPARNVNTVPNDVESFRLQAQRDAVKKQVDKLELQIKAENRTPGEKARTALAKWTRVGALSWPTVFAKLTGAAIMRSITTPLEQAAGYGISKVLPELSAKAAREGVPDLLSAVHAESKALTEGLTTGMRGAWDMLRNRETDLQKSMEKAHLDPALIDYLGKMHGAFKYPTQIAEYSRTLELLSDHAIRNGLDPTDPIVQTRLMNEAWKEGKRAIFMQDNQLLNGYKALISTWEKGPGAKYAALAAKTELPIVKVPLNVVAEASNAITGLLTGSARAAWAYHKGLENLKPAEADSIMRNLKKGLIGSALLLLGFYKHKDIGGSYVQGQPGGSSNKTGLKPGEIRITGFGGQQTVPAGYKPSEFTIPAGSLHGPYADVVNMGGTIGNLVGTRMAKNQPDKMGLGAATMASAVGLLDGVPFVRETTTLGHYLDPRQQGNALAEKAASVVVPGAVTYAAQAFDKQGNKSPLNFTAPSNVRQPKGLLQNIEADIPGLREQVPLKRKPPPPGMSRFGKPLRTSR